MVTPSPAVAFADWYQTWEKQLRDLLVEAQSDVTRRLKMAEGMRGSQLRNSRAAIRATLADLNSDTYTLLKAGRLDVAALAGRITVDMEADLLSNVFTRGQIEGYARQEAARAASALDNAMRRMRGDSYKPLSEQVYKTTALSNGLVDRKVNLLIAQGASARDIAAAVRSMINPDVAGGVSYASMRLGRTELNNAFHASAADRYRQSPFVAGVEWNLSGSHPRTDICNELAGADVANMGDGVYPPEDVPDKPHPQCLCYITPVTITDEQFITEAAAGRFDTYASGDSALGPLPPSAVLGRTKVGAPIHPLSGGSQAIDINPKYVDLSKKLANGGNITAADDRALFDALDNWTVGQGTLSPQVLAPYIEDPVGWLTKYVPGDGTIDDQVYAFMQTFEASGRNSTTLFRGFGAPNTELGRYAPGKIIESGPTSWSESREVAEYMGGLSTYEDKTLIEFHLPKGGAKSMNITGFESAYQDQKEWVAGGKWVVDRTANSTYINDFDEVKKKVIVWLVAVA